MVPGTWVPAAPAGGQCRQPQQPVGSGGDEVVGAEASGDVAGDDVDLGMGRLDLLEDLDGMVGVAVCDIEDEHDVAEDKYVQRVEGEGEVFVADARTPLAEVSEVTGVDLVAAVGEMAEEIDTLGGMIVTLAGRVPSRGELIAGWRQERREQHLQHAVEGIVQGYRVKLSPKLERLVR